jgi:hypothetical protein
MKECDFCGFEVADPADYYCRNCGKVVGSNYCTNPECSGRTVAGVPSPLTGSDCYCPVCGAKSAYFAQGHIVSGNLREARRRLEAE